MAQSSWADDFLSKVADSFSLYRYDLPQGRRQMSTSFDELTLEDGDSTRDSFHGLEKRVENRLLKAPEIHFGIVL